MEGRPWPIGRIGVSIPAGLAQSALIAHVNVILQTQGTQQGTQIMVVLPLTSVIVIGWIVAAALLLAGYYERKVRLFQYGAVVAGIMTIVPPLMYYLYEAGRLGGVYPAGPLDLIILAVLSAAGGAIMTLGVLSPRTRPSPS